MGHVNNDVDNNPNNANIAFVLLSHLVSINCCIIEFLGSRPSIWYIAHPNHITHDSVVF